MSLAARLHAAMGLDGEAPAYDSDPAASARLRDWLWENGYGLAFYGSKPTCTKPGCCGGKGWNVNITSSESRLDIWETRRSFPSALALAAARALGVES